MPGTLAPWLSMNLLSSSLGKTQAVDVAARHKQKKTEEKNDKKSLAVEVDDDINSWTPLQTLN